jgi:hypothetical protein
MHANPARVLLTAGSKNIHIYSRTTGQLSAIDAHSKPTRIAKQVGERVISGGMDCTLKLFRVR